MTSTAAPDDTGLTARPAQQPKSRRFKSLRVIVALMMREIASTDSRSSLGFLWTVLDPVATVLLLTFMFQLFTKTPPLGTNFPLYYVTGYGPFHLFLSLSLRVSSSVRYSKPLLEFPAVSVLDAIVARFLLNFVVNVAAFLLMVFGIIKIYQLNVIIDIPMAAESIALASLLALGIGTFNSVLFLAFPVWDNIYSVITRPLMLVSGVLFQINSIPKPYVDWALWNPVAHVVALMRGAFYPGFDASFASPMLVLMVSIVTFTIGLVTLKTMFRDALNR